jgi:TetR/AcrR family transcriptional repressor of mexJK operon
MPQNQVETAAADPDAPRGNMKSKKILEAACEVFLEHGFSASADMIQQAAGVSKATIYAHFGSKEALFIAAVEQLCGEITAPLRLAESAPGRLREALTMIARTYLTQAISPTGLGLARVVIAEAPRFPQLGRTFFLAGPRVFCSIVGEHLARGVESGEIELSAIGVESAANQFFSLVRGEPQMEFFMHPQSRPSEAQLEHWANIAVTTFMRAYGKPDQAR